MRINLFLQTCLPNNFGKTWPALLAAAPLGFGAAVQGNGVALQGVIDGWPEGTVGFVSLVFGFAQVLMLGILQHWGHRVVSPAAVKGSFLAMIAACAFLIFFHETVEVWLVFAFMRGSAYALLYHVLSVRIAEGLDTEDAAKGFSIYWISICIGALAGSAVTGMFAVDDITFIILAFAHPIGLVMFFLRGWPALSVGTSSLPQAIRMTLRAPWMWSAAILAGVFGETLYAYAATVTAPADAEGAGWPFTLLLVGAIVFKYPAVLAGGRSLEAQRAVFISICGVTAILFMMMPILLPYGLPRSVMFLALGGTMGVLTIASDTLLCRRYSGGDRAPAIALSTLLYFLGMGLGTQVAGLLLEWFGPLGIVGFFVPLCVAHGMCIQKELARDAEM